MIWLKKSFLIMLVLTLVATPLLAESGKGYAQGRLDGEADAEGNGLWVLAGIGCGVLGVLGALLIKPAAPTENLIGKDSDYILGYTDGYQKKAVKKNTTFAAVGCVAWSIVSIIIQN